MAVETTTGVLSNQMMRYYERKFLDRAKFEYIHDIGLQKKTHKKNNGKLIQFTQFNVPNVATTPLPQEGDDPAAISLSDKKVDVILQEYGNFTRISNFLTLTSIDANNAEKAEVFGQNMGETADTLVREMLFDGATVLLPTGVANMAALDNANAAHKLNAVALRKIRRNLRRNKARRYKDGYYKGKISVDTAFDFTGDSTWENAKIQSGKDLSHIYMHTLGALNGIVLYETVNNKVEAGVGTAGADVHSNFFHGENAAGTVDLEKDPFKMYIKTPNSNDTSNPLNRRSTMGWAGTWGGVVLNPDWIVNYKTVATV